MANIDEQILRATKEIVVKFIENGRISPSGFHETFESIYQTVEKTAKASHTASIADAKKEGEEKKQVKH
jgi:predicted transcriptional regulator